MASRQPRPDSIASAPIRLLESSGPESSVSARLDSAPRAGLYLLIVAVASGVFVRAIIAALAGGFPVNDGGLFYALVEDVKASGYRLPDFTSYNGGEVPFAYPPLAFYAGALTSDVGGLSTTHVLVILPFLFSVLTILAVYLLSREYFRSSVLAGLAVVVFALVPRSFGWEIAGGGLTRSPGFFFAVLAIWQGYRMYSQWNRTSYLLAALFGGLAILFHPEMGWFVAFTLAGCYLAKDRTGRGLLRSVSVGLGVLVLAMPWWLGVLVRMGPEPLLSAGQSGSTPILPVLRLLTFDFTEEPFFPIAAGLGLLGVLATVKRREHLLTLWLVAIFALDARMAATTSMVPLSMLAAIGLRDVVGPLVREAVPRAAVPGGEGLPRWAYGVAAVLVLVVAPLATLFAATENDSPLHFLSAGNRDAMSWVNSNTPAGAPFLVMPSTTGWQIDAPSEWFPALAARRSISTVQGYEWLGAASFRAQQKRYTELQRCAIQSSECLSAWREATGLSFDYVYVSKGVPPSDRHRHPGQKIDCCAGLRANLAFSSEYVQVYDGPGATIFRRR